MLSPQFKIKLFEVMGGYWYTKIEAELEKGYIEDIMLRVQGVRNKGIEVFPSNKEIFNAFLLTRPTTIKVVILGQDPYFTPGDAHGLAFSTLKDIRPPSLTNIFEEIYREFYKGEDFDNIFKTNNLECWARQGVFLLNTILTVEKGKPLSHENIGWKQFTHFVISLLGKRPDPMVFMLWGKEAKSYKHLIEPYHCILEASHPSPRSVEMGFIGCNHFRRANGFLGFMHGTHTEINWNTWDWKEGDIVDNSIDDLPF